MNLSDWQIKKIETLAQYQETIADLYTLIGEKIPRYNIILLPIAVKNLNYANWLRSLPEKILKGEYEYEIMRFKIESVFTALNYLKGEFKSIRENNISINSALGILKGVESSDLACKFYEIVFQEDNESSELENLKNDFKLEKIDTLHSLKEITYKKVVNQLHK